MDILTIILRIIHIFSGVFWAGSAWLFLFFLGPTAQALGADGGKFMGYLLNQRRFSTYLGAAAGLTILAGLILFFMRYGIASLSTGPGLTFALGGVFGIIGGVIGPMVGSTAKKLTDLGGQAAAAGKPPTSEQMAQMGALQKRMSSLSLWNAIVVALALLLMVSARYV